ncbi:MAG: TetR/AcrR family transcriptional regulator [Deltaproteobacteria bacterium]|nr:MAG: TetR/AcrR family transcriptional regulator [Deltaproteobacteria bacterium]
MSRRQELLRAATHHFGARGYGEAHVADIAAEIGYTKAALYYHFASKETLWREALATVLDRLDEAMDSCGDTAALEPWLRCRFEAVSRWAAADPDACRLVVRAAWERPEDHEWTEARFSTQWRAFRDRFGERPVLELALRGLMRELMRTIAEQGAVPDAIADGLAAILGSQGPGKPTPPT